ncbi:transcriptional regulator NrdR [candidate division WOR-1 bacterium RIFOXYB2_FULL_42_35]|uniref:Transcriptional repressor NrdR n=1 Tax=candidate division WOR-1 bacterium RIFOXYC2_FULL_41_25 TaxID=1802586 RepID=A0A1F4TLP6_UNCSA|nr:MAG: transcriptional regulator NrdR [candidate division WOR-1 bacterium RIFOXYA2_FULL_41_14]OGC23470.1 MAG: transcriptional regulator NrdR [candidate division WOR-1 bacterium RIFOXYB2_FULL_42_35]OGC32993.1 MAG: transcriptional regulator NrdR [candidate division WOR-1 bacterium RIFOXYC2_FULL_41_25]OGC44113.1 MAG: transcriptional regulator NrdR [candidate division WOR-1 bacterium RIFOXYD2_FULL_41_8]
MKCPFCDAIEDKVLESRETEEGKVIRRRRECLSCRERFTSYERVEEKPVSVIKRDGRKEQFSREKVTKGILRACEKRPVSAEAIEELVDEVEKQVHREAGREVNTVKIGELVMAQLQNIDKIAYVRFASVCRKFENLSEFIREVNEITVGG